MALETLVLSEAELPSLLGAMVRECQDAVADLERNEEMDGQVAALLAGLVSRQAVVIQLLAQLLDPAAAPPVHEEPPRIVLPGL